MKAVQLLVFGLLVAGTLNAQTNNSYSYKDLDGVFYNAYGAFLDGDDEESADQLEDAADWLKDYGKTFNDEAIEDRYKDYAKMLNSLADAVERGEIMDDGQLRYAFAKIHHDIADIYGDQADSYYAKKDMKNTGNALSNTAGYLSRAGMWSGSTTYASRNYRSTGPATTMTAPGENSMTDGNGNRVVKGTKKVAGTTGKVVEGTGKAVYKGGKAVTKTAYKGAKGVAKGTARGIGWIGRKLFGGDDVDDAELKETMDYQKRERDNMRKSMERDTDVDGPGGVHPSIYDVGTNY